MALSCSDGVQIAAMLEGCVCVCSCVCLFSHPCFHTLGYRCSSFCCIFRQLCRRPSLLDGCVPERHAVCGVPRALCEAVPLGFIEATCVVEKQQMESDGEGDMGKSLTHWGSRWSGIRYEGLLRSIPELASGTPFRRVMSPFLQGQPSPRMFSAYFVVSC